MPLSSASTINDVQASYMDNASYEQNASPAQCGAFITACRFLLLILPKSGGQAGANMVLSPELIQEEMADAKRWLASNPGSDGGGGGVGFFSFNFLR